MLPAVESSSGLLIGAILAPAVGCLGAGAENTLCIYTTNTTVPSVSHYWM